MATRTNKRTTSRGSSKKQDDKKKRTTTRTTKSNRASTTRGAGKTGGKGTTAKRTSGGRTTSTSRARSTAGRTRGQSRAGAGNGGSGSTQRTIDHDEIRRWVQERGGFPATVRNTASDDEAGILRIDFPGYSGKQSLERISWDEFFDKFEEAQLAFLYQDKLRSGKPSRFAKFVARNQEGE